jgi:hypothetical protein
MDDFSKKLFKAGVTLFVISFTFLLMLLMFLN